MANWLDIVDELSQGSWNAGLQLDQANSNERVLFPGLDGLSRWRARYYTPTANTHRSEARAPRTAAATSPARRRLEFSVERSERMEMPS